MRFEPTTSPAPRAAAAGFTIIELLAAIAVIAILLAILMPAVKAIRARARETQSVNNIKQIGFALKQYELEYMRLPATFGQWTTTTQVGSANYTGDRTWCMADSYNFDSAPEAGSLWKFIGNSPESLVSPLETSDGNGKFSYAMPVLLGFKSTQNSTKAGEDVLMIEEDATTLGRPTLEGGSREGSFGAGIGGAAANGQEIPTTRNAGNATTLFIDGSGAMKDWTQYVRPRPINPPTGYTHQDRLFTGFGTVPQARELVIRLGNVNVNNTAANRDTTD